MIKINIDKAKEITKDRLRQERTPLFQQLDVEFMRAVETGDSQKITEIAEQKQVLRDVTKLVDTCTNVDELKSIQIN